MSRGKAHLAVLVAMTAPAAAQPEPQPRTCEVRFVRAPDDVRHVIESWLAAEPRCTSTIDLRVIPTDAGYYLIAQRPDGRLHERYVPDAQSAGVLVASWVADDWVAPRTEPGFAAPGGAVSSAPASSPSTPPLYLAPSETPAITSVAAPRARHAGEPRWLSLGAMFDTDDSADGGLRAELDLIAKGSLTLGVSLAWTETSMRVWGGNPGTMRSNDVAATGYGAYTLRYGRWELRGALGLGGVYTDALGSLDTGSPTMGYFEGSGGGVVGTASLLSTLRIGERWGLTAGLTAHHIAVQFPTKTAGDVERQDSRVFFFTGLRRRI